MRVYNAWLQGGGVVGTSAYTDCYDYEPYVYTRGEIWRSRWYGWEKMDEDPRSDDWTSYVSSYPSWYCHPSTHNWEGRSYHKVQWYNGTYSTAYLYSSDTPRISC